VYVMVLLLRVPGMEDGFAGEPLTCEGKRGRLGEEGEQSENNFDGRKAP